MTTIEAQPEYQEKKMKPIVAIIRNRHTALYRLFRTEIRSGHKIEIYNFRDTEVFMWQVDGKRFAGERWNSPTAAAARAIDFINGIIG
ncbi:MAG: hypothetical protein BWY31_03505 [Lentisphaerae bacterium ADurb.Bin242]|nr:MAG: hypothetical protein BWY31_03505 [Lentisphaerae bacterium ADurb.Bin242]